MTCLAIIDQGMSSQAPEVTTTALAGLAALFGRELNYATRGAFDQFMLMTDGPIII